MAKFQIDWHVILQIQGITFQIQGNNISRLRIVKKYFTCVYLFDLFIHMAYFIAVLWAVNESKTKNGIKNIK